MSKTYYELLDVPASATLEDIKRNFRREIAKYHPDKVQHLGKEFQDIAATKAAELTQAYKTLCDENLRAEYDESLRGAPAAVHQASAPAAPAADPAYAAPVPPVPPAPGVSVFHDDRVASSDLIQRATILRFRQAIQAEFGAHEAPAVPGFAVTCVAKPSFFKKAPPVIFGRFVSEVTAAEVTGAWSTAVRAKKDPQRDVVVFLMGPTVAPAGELAVAIADQRRKPASTRLTLVPVNTRNWSAHIPNDAPPVVKSLLDRLRSA
jgi:hypothetical protein